jgi:hypothetical protein
MVGPSSREATGVRASPEAGRKHAEVLCGTCHTGADEAGYLSVVTASPSRARRWPHAVQGVLTSDQQVAVGEMRHLPPRGGWLCTEAGAHRCGLCRVPCSARVEDRGTGSVPYVPRAKRSTTRVRPVRLPRLQAGSRGGKTSQRLKAAADHVSGRHQLPGKSHLPARQAPCQGGEMRRLPSQVVRHEKGRREADYGQHGRR